MYKLGGLECFTRELRFSGEIRNNLDWELKIQLIAEDEYIHLLQEYPIPIQFFTHCLNSIKVSLSEQASCLLQVQKAKKYS